MGRNLRSELEVAISARVDRVAATGSLGPVLDPIALMQAKWLADLLEGGDLPDPPPSVSLVLAQPAAGSILQTRNSKVAELEISAGQVMISGSKTIQVEVKE